MREQQPCEAAARRGHDRPGAPLRSLTLAAAFFSGEPEDQAANIPARWAEESGLLDVHVRRSLPPRSDAAAQRSAVFERAYRQGLRVELPRKSLAVMSRRSSVRNVLIALRRRVIRLLTGPLLLPKRGAPLWKPRQEIALTVPFSCSQGIFRIGWPDAIPAAAGKHPLAGAFPGPRFAASMQRWGP